MSLTRMAVFGRMMVAVTLLCVAERIVQTAVVPLSADSQAESELSSLAQQPPPLGLSDKGDAERMLQSAQDTPDTYEKALQDIVQGDKNVDLVQDSAEQGNGESQNILEEALQEEEDKTGWPEDSESFDTDKNSSALKQLEITPEDELHSDESQETELLDLVDESDKTDRDYDKASRGIHRPEEEGSDVGGHAKVAAGRSSEDSSPSDEDYDGFGSDDTDKEGWREVPNTDKLADDLPAFPSDGWGPMDGPGGDVSQSMHRERSNTPLSPLNTDQLDEVRPYLDDAIPNRGGSYDVHDDVKRGQDFVQVPGFPPLRVIELNETIYLNNTDHETQPEFQPVRMPERFEDYDVNKDGLISLPELRYVTGAIEGAKQAFGDADIDGDGWVEQEEFRMSGWGLPLDPPSPPPPRGSVVFVPRENTRPSSIPRAAEDVRSRRPDARRLP